MNLFGKFKKDKKTDKDIIASVEEENIVNEENRNQPIVVVQQVPVKSVEEPVEEVVEEPVEQTVEEPVEEVVEEPVEQAVEEPVEEPVEEVAEVAEEPVEEPVEEPIEEVVQEPVEEVVQEPVEDVVVPAVEEVEEGAEEEIKQPVYQPTFAEKMNIADEDMQRWYNEIKNYALRFKKLTSRISKKYDSINQGRFQFVKISLAGKTLKLNLNMDISECDPKYHCVDKRSIKTYEEVPAQMRIKSDRGLRYGKELIDQCAAKYGLIENPKFKGVDSLELIRNHLELGSTDDIIIETDDDEE